MRIGSPLRTDPLRNLYSGGNLIANGFGESGDNTNFSNWVYDRVVMPEGASCSFRWPDPNQSGTFPLADSRPIIDASRLLRFRGSIIIGDPDGSNYNSTRRQHLAIMCYDGDMQMISDSMSDQWAGSALTTLASPLSQGDTTVVLTSSAGWQNAGNWFERRLAWWVQVPGYGYGYAEASGRVHVPYTYTRLASAGNSTNGGTWNAGGIAGNVVTLNPLLYPAGWTHGALPAGTPIRNAQGGGALRYAISSAMAQGVTRYNRTFSALTENSPDFLLMRGTTFISLNVLMNYSGSAGPCSVRYAGIDIRYAS